MQNKQRQTTAAYGLAVSLGLLCSMSLACAGSGGSASKKGGNQSFNAAPTVAFVNLGQAVQLSRGNAFQISLVASDSDDQALVDVFADRDGQLNTTHDQVQLADDLLEDDGATLFVDFDTTAWEAGTYFVVATIIDGKHAVIANIAAGTLEVQNVSWATSAGGVRGDHVLGVAPLHDQSAVVAGHFRAAAVFDGGGTNETVVSAVGEDDLYVARFDKNGDLHWVSRAGGPLFDKALAVTANSQNQSLVCGFFESDAVFGANELQETTLQAVSGSDVFLAAYNSDGTLAWAKAAGGLGFEQATANLCFADDSILIAGDFAQDLTLGLGEPQETSFMAQGTSDLFLAKYDAQGNLQWATNISGDQEAQCRDLTAYADGSFAIAGVFEGEITLGAGEAFETQLQSSGSADIFLARYQADGTLLWAKQAGGNGLDAGLGVALLSDNSLALVGKYEQSAWFGAGEPNAQNLVAMGAGDIFYARYQATGELSWVQTVGDVEEDVARDVVALKNEEFVITGLFRGTVSFDGGLTSFTADGLNDSFVAKVNAGGQVQWAKRAGGSGKDGAFGIGKLADESILLAGRYFNTALFGAGDQNQTSLQSAGERDIYVARFNPDGGF